MRILDRPAVLMEKAVNTDPNGSVLADASAFFKLEPSETVLHKFGYVNRRFPVSLIKIITEGYRTFQKS